MLISWLLICPCLVAVIKASASLGRTVSNAEDVASSQLSLQNDFPIIPATAAPLPDTYWPLDAPSPITNFTALRISPNLTAPNIACDGKAYGRNLRFDSCLQVWHAMSNVDKPRTFGDRAAGAWDAPLPFRYLSHDGLCAVDVSHSHGSTFDTVTPLALKETARLLIQICVQTPPSIGGLATGLGENKALSMRIVPYKPTVYCGPVDSGPPWITCRHILDVMPANNKRQYFAPKEWGNGTVALPCRFTTAAKRCSLTIEGTELDTVADYGDWYKIWAAANAVDYMCCQLGRKGVAIALGEGKKLHLELKDMSKPELMANSSIESS